MITRLYVNNFQCLVAFEAHLDSFEVLCGPNGAGKSSVFAARQLIRNLATGDGFLGGTGERNLANLEFTSWMASRVQEFELEVTADSHVFHYKLHLEQVGDQQPRIIREQATCD